MRCEGRGRLWRKSWRGLFVCEDLGRCMLHNGKQAPYRRQRAAIEIARHCIVAIARYGGLTATQPRSHQKPSATPEAYSRETFHVGSTTSPFRAHARFYRIMHQQSDTSPSTSKMHAPEIYDLVARRISVAPRQSPRRKRRRRRHRWQHELSHRHLRRQKHHDHA